MLADPYGAVPQAFRPSVTEHGTAVAIAVRNESGRRRWSKLREWLQPRLAAIYKPSSAVGLGLDLYHVAVDQQCRLGLKLD